MPSNPSQSRVPFDIIRGFDLIISDPDAGYTCSLQENRKRFPIIRMVEDNEEGISYVKAMLNHHGYLSSASLRKAAKELKFDVVARFVPQWNSTGIQSILSSGETRIGTLDKDSILSFFGPTLGTYLLQQETPTRMTDLLLSKPKECLTIYGFILPKHLQWADATAKKKSR